MDDDIDVIHDYIKRYYSYKENECIMKYFLIKKLILSEINDNNLILGNKKNIIGKEVFPFNYYNRNGDIMTFLDKYIIITFYPKIN